MTYYLRERWQNQDHKDESHLEPLFDARTLTDVHEHIRTQATQKKYYSADILEWVSDLTVQKMTDYDGKEYYIICKFIGSVSPKVETKVTLYDRHSQEIIPEVTPPTETADGQ